jgi:hypothetical protein
MTVTTHINPELLKQCHDHLSNGGTWPEAEEMAGVSHIVLRGAFKRRGWNDKFGRQETKVIPGTRWDGNMSRQLLRMPFPFKFEALETGEA